MPAEYVLHLERRLVAVNDGQRAVAAIEVGDQAARFQRERRSGARSGIRPRRRSRPWQRRLPALPLLIEKSKATLSPSSGWTTVLLGVERIERFADGGQRLPLDVDERGAVLGLGPARSHHGDDRLTLPDRASVRQQPLRRRPVPGPMQRDTDQRLAHRIEIGCGQHRLHARRRCGACRIDRFYPRIADARCARNTDAASAAA